MLEIAKPAYNEEYRTMQFRRPDGKGQLTSEETVTAAEVVCTDAIKGITDASMISDVAPYDQTQVRFKLKGGVPGRAYFLAIHVTTSLDQKLSETVLLKVTN